MKCRGVLVKCQWRVDEVFIKCQYDVVECQWGIGEVQMGHQ